MPSILIVIVELRSGDRYRRHEIIVVFSMSSGGSGAGPKRSLGGFQRAIAKLGKQAVAVKALMVGNAALFG